VTAIVHRAYRGVAGPAAMPLLAAALAAYALFLASGYDLRILTLAGVWTIMVLGYQFVFGHAGALSLAQGAFFGAGAYVTGILGAQFGQGFLVTFPLSVALAAGLAALVAVPVLRLASHYFALATLALAQLLLLVAVNWEGVTGGANGIPGVPPVDILGWRPGRGLPLLVFVWALAGIAMLVARAQLSPLRTAAFTVVRETPLAAPAFGIDAGLLRLRAFVLSAAFGGAAGALFVHTNRVVSPEVLGFTVMVTVLTMTVVGGRLRIAGAVIGALLLNHLPEWFRGLDAWYLAAVGALLLAVVVFAPDGLAPLLFRKRARTVPDLPPSGSGDEHPVTPETASRVIPEVTPRKTPASGGVTGTLVLEGLTRNYGGVRALDGAGLSVAQGEIVGLIGPNGAGKTTLANVATGLAMAEAGTVRLGAADLTRTAPERRVHAGIARTFQTPQLPGGLRVRDVAATAAAFAPRAQANAVTNALSRCGLLAHADTDCATLPHGLRRRAELARAAATAPVILLLDEPAAGLTPEEQVALADICRGFAADGIGLLVIDHNVEFLRPLVTRLACMDGGRIIADGAPEAVLADPAVRAAYLGSLGA
jgi:branched-chain amino acid transport system permease protein